MRYLIGFALLALAACQDPALSFGARVSGGHVDVSPAVSGRIGGLSVAVAG